MERRQAIKAIPSAHDLIRVSELSVHAVSKFTVLKNRTLTEGTAREFAPKGSRVNGIASAFFPGHQNHTLLVAGDQTGNLTDRSQSIIDRTSFGRFGGPADTEGVTLFLANRQSARGIYGTTEFVSSESYLRRPIQHDDVLEGCRIQKDFFRYLVPSTSVTIYHRLLATIN